MTMVGWTRVQLERTLTSVSVRLNHDLLKCVRGIKEPPVCDLDWHNIQHKRDHEEDYVFSFLFLRLTADE